MTPLFPGPKYAGPQAERYRIQGEVSLDTSVDYCSGCGLCTQACPQGVKIAELNAHARHQLKERDGVKLRDRIIARPTVVGRLGTPVAPLANLTLKLKPARVLVEQTLGLHRDAPLPAFAGHRFGTWARKREAPATGTRSCSSMAAAPSTTSPRSVEKVVEVLEHNGFRVEVPKQDCCGLPLQSNGLFDDARKYVLRLARSLAPRPRDGSIIVGNATSCTVMLKREAREILGLEDDPDLALVSRQTYDICELLLELHDAGELKTDFQPVQRRSPTTPPASSRATGSASPRSICCGWSRGSTSASSTPAAAGSPGPTGSRRRSTRSGWPSGADLFGQVAASGAGLVACDSETCRWQIDHGTGHKSIHPVELLHRAYGL